jgi:aspartate beta-hydroxylase/beta-hydroxylase
MASARGWAGLVVVAEKSASANGAGRRARAGAGLGSEIRSMSAIIAVGKVVRDGVNAFFDIWTGGARRPVFHDAAKLCPELKELDRNYPEIRREVENLLAIRSRIPTYHEMDGAQAPISAATAGDWRVFVLAGPGLDLTENHRLCPKTSELLGKVPNLFQAFVSILDPKKKIPAHCGPYRGYLRYHLGLIVPKNNPPRIRIKDQYHQWEEGKSVMFDDSLEHEVFNECEEIRVVLIVDILRPMPALPHLVNRVLTKYLISNFYYKKVYAGKAALKRLD